MFRRLFSPHEPQVRLFRALQLADEEQFVILDRQSGAKEAALASSGTHSGASTSIPSLRHSLFLQLENQLRMVDAQALRRRGQVCRPQQAGSRLKAADRRGESSL